MADVSITGPDGATFKFPEGTPMETITGALQTHYGKTQAPAAVPPVSGDFERDTSIASPAMERETDVARRANIALRGVQGTFGRVGGFDPIGANIPFADEAVSAMAGVGGLFNGRGMGEEYQRQMEAEAQAKDQYAKENPVKNALGTIAGGVLTGPGGMGGGGGLFQQMVKTGAQGGAYGAVSGAGEGQGSDRLTNAIGGAKTGATLGAALPLGIAAGTGLYKAGRQALSPATNAIMNRLAPDAQAAKLVERAFERDGMTLKDAASKLKQGAASNPEGLLADVGGNNVRGLSRYAVNVPGAAREEIVTAMEKRNLGQQSRIIAKSEEALAGTADDFERSIANQVAQREKMASPLYNKSFEQNTPVNVTGVVKHIDDQISPGISGMANPIADLRPDGITATLSKLRSFFATAKNQRVDLKQLHQIKMELDGMIGVAKRAGDNTKVRALMGVQTELLRAMDKGNPLYKQARGIFAGSHKLQEAGELGENVFKMTAGEIRQATAGMSKAERDVYTLGVAKAMRARIGGVGEGRDVVKGAFNNDNIMETVRAAMPDDQSFRKLQAQLMREKAMRKTSDAVRGNSTTASQLSEIQDQRGLGTDVLTHIVNGQPIKAASAAFKQILMGERGMNEATANAVGRLLLSKNPKQLDAAVKLMEARGLRAERIRDVISKVSGLLTQTGAQAYPQLAPAN